MKRVYRLCSSVVLALLVCLTGVLQAAPKRMAVAPFDYQGDKAFADSLVDFDKRLLSALEKSARFNLVPVSEVAEANVDGKISSDWTEDHARSIAEMTSADFVVYGAITSVEKQQGLSGVQVSIDLNVLDKAQDDLRIAETVDIHENELGRINASSVRTLTRHIVLGLYPITVIKAKEDSVTLNYGKDFLTKGQHLDIVEQGELLTDPATGIELGRENSVAGKLKVVKAYGRSSTADVVDSDKAIKVGAACVFSDSPAVRPVAVAAPAAVRAVAAQQPTMPPVSALPTYGKIKVAVGDFIYGSNVDLDPEKKRHEAVHVPKGHEGVSEIGRVLFGDLWPTSTKGNDRYKQSENQPGPLAYKSHLLRETVATHLVKTGQFEVMERSRLNEVMREIELIEKGGNGYFDKSKLAQVNLQGADYLAYGTITKMSANRRSINGVFVDENAVNFSLTIDLRVVDLRTGGVVASEEVTANGKSIRRNASILGILGSRKESGGGIDSLLSTCADKIANTMVTALRPVVIVGVTPEQNQVVVNYGGNTINPGDVYDIYSAGKKVFDQYTGELLGNDGGIIARATVSQVSARMSRLTINEKKPDMSRFEVGQICKPYMKPVKVKKK